MYVEQPKGYMVKGSEHMVYKPHNALYELGLAALNLTSSVKDSKKVWNDRFKENDVLSTNWSEAMFRWDLHMPKEICFGDPKAIWLWGMQFSMQS